MTASRSEKAEATRARVLDAAALLFSEQGYGPVSLRMVAEAVGMKAGSLYYHFANKEEMIEAVMEKGVEAIRAEVSARLADLRAEASASERLRVAVHAHLRALHAVGAHSSANIRIFGQLPPDIRARQIVLRRRYEEIWEQILVDLAAEGALRAQIRPTHARLMLLGALNATLEWFDPKKGSLPLLAESYADMALRGLMKSG